VRGSPKSAACPGEIPRTQTSEYDRTT
jgi:hypothetical protein